MYDKRAYLRRQFQQGVGSFLDPNVVVDVLPKSDENAEHILRHAILQHIAQSHNPARP
jgi:hypothetical protein